MYFHYDILHLYIYMYYPGLLIFKINIFNNPYTRQVQYLDRFGKKKAQLLLDFFYFNLRLFHFKTTLNPPFPFFCLNTFLCPLGHSTVFPSIIRFPSVSGITLLQFASPHLIIVLNFAILTPYIDC